MKLVAGLSFVIILLSAICGVLYYQISEVQSQIGDLENQTSVLERQVSEYENQTGQLENQISELETQLDDLEAQNLELLNQTSALEAKLVKVSNASRVRIADTSFNLTAWGTLPPVVAGIFSVTVQNFGTNDVDGLNLWVKDSYSGEYFVKRPIGTLKGGEAQNVSSSILLRNTPASGFVATLMLDDVILDEWFTHYRT